MVPGTTLEQTQAVVDRVAHLLRQQKTVTSVYQRSFVGSGRVTAQLADDREITSVQFDRGLAPELNQIADARVNFQSQGGRSEERRVGKGCGRTFRSRG